MTRIGYFELYECPKCRQIHIKSNYSSISVYRSTLPMEMPRDVFYAPTDLKICQKCGEKLPFSEYVLTGHMKPLRFKEQGIDPRNLFPHLTDSPCTSPIPNPKEILNRIGNESFYRFGRKIPKSFISIWMGKCKEGFRILFN